jgi:hypothetical protein
MAILKNTTNINAALNVSRNTLLNNFTTCRSSLNVSGVTTLSVGEGGIWICISNGNIENGDYITSSDYLGYGEKQDDDLLHNYTVAKATIDSNFELDI